MDKNRSREAPTWRQIPYEKRLGSRAIDMKLIVPIGGAPTGIVHPIIPGLGARDTVYLDLAIALAERGHMAALVAYDGCSDAGGQAVEYVLGSLEDGSFNGIPVPVSEHDEIIAVNHSLGGRKFVTAAERLKAKGSRLRYGIFEAAACFGGVHPVKAPVDAVWSIHKEMRHIQMSGAIRHRQVALDALRATLSLRNRLLQEVHIAMHDSIEERVAALQEQGMEFAGVHHPDDILVSSEKNQIAFDRLGIRSVDVDAPYTGHVVPLYYPYQTATAIEQANWLLQPAYKKAS